MGRSTREKGDCFEDRVYECLKAAFRERRFGLDPSCAIYRRKPSYFSRDRDADIVFDISIELKPEAAAKPFLTIVIECKDCGRPVSVDDLEEFKAKLDQCFGKNVKGFFISSNALQKGALNYAEAQGIGVGRFLKGAVQMASYCFSYEGLRQEGKAFDKELVGGPTYEEAINEFIGEDGIESFNDFEGVFSKVSFREYSELFMINRRPVTSFSHALSLLRDFALSTSTANFPSIDISLDG